MLDFSFYLSPHFLVFFLSFLSMYSDNFDSVTNNLRNSANGTFVTSDDTFPLTTRQERQKERRDETRQDETRRDMKTREDERGDTQDTKIKKREDKMKKKRQDEREDQGSRENEMN